MLDIGTITTLEHFAQRTNKMTSLKNIHHYAVDVSDGVLDLSKNKSDFNSFDNRKSPDSFRPSSSPDGMISTTHQMEDGYQSKHYENSIYRSYSTPEGNSSPNYASCYPGTEHLSPYILQAAFRQQTILQTKRTSPKSDNESHSDAGSESSSATNFPIYPLPNATGRDGKMPRPFKAYPKDPLSLAAGFTNIDAVLDTQSAEKYSTFRKRMLEQICEANGGQATITNPKMRRVNHNNNITKCPSNENSKSDSKDDSYTERRRKNNAAAKKSRDRRRIKEDEIAIRAAFLERENIELKFELAAARKQLALCGITVTTTSSN